MGNIIFECFFRLFFEGLFEFLFNKYPKLGWGLWCAFSLLFGFYFFALLMKEGKERMLQIAQGVYDGKHEKQEQMQQSNSNLGYAM